MAKSDESVRHEAKESAKERSKEYSKASAGELAKQFVKEAASGAFSKKGAAARGAEVVSKRSRTAGAESFDTNTYRDRQYSDRNN